MDLNQEGMTEWIQTGLDAYNVAIAEGSTQEQAGESLANAMFSAEGLEAYLQGIAGAGVAASSGRLTRGIIKKESRDKIVDARNKIQDIANDISKATTPEAKANLVEAAANLSESITQEQAEGLAELSNVDETVANEVIQTQDRIQSLDATLETQELAPGTVEVLEAERAQLEQQITDIETQQETTTEQESTVEAPAEVTQASSELAQDTSFFQSIQTEEGLATEEARLKEYFSNFWKDSQNLGSSFDSQRSAAQDIEFIKNAAKYVAVMATKGIRYTRSELSNLVGKELTDTEYGNITQVASDTFSSLEAGIQAGEVTNVTTDQVSTTLANIQAINQQNTQEDSFRSYFEGRFKANENLTVDQVMESIQSGENRSSLFQNQEFTPEQLQDIRSIADNSLNLVRENINLTTTSPTAAKTRSTVRENTDGGTRGKITKTIQQANRDYYATLEKGVKLGSREARNAAKAYSKQVKDALKQDYKDAPAPIASIMSDRDLTTLSGRIATARTPKDFYRIITFVDKLANKAEAAQTLFALSKFRDRAKSRAKSDKVPANIREIFSAFSGIGTSDLYQDIATTTANLSKAQSLLDRMNDLYQFTKPGGQYKGNIADLTQLKADIKDFTDTLERARFREELPAMIDHLKALTAEAGGRYYYTDAPRTFRDYRFSVDALEKTILEQNPDRAKPKEKTKAREANEDFVNNNLHLLEDVDMDVFLPNELSVIESLSQITPEVVAEMTDADVLKLSIALPNIINNGRLDGIASAVAKANSIALSLDDSFTGKVKKAMAEIPALGSFFKTILRQDPSRYDKLAKALMSAPQRLDALFKDMFTQGEFMQKFGIQPYKEARNKAQRRYEAAQTEFESMMKKSPAVKEFLRSPNRGQREVKLGIYAWMNQQETGMTVSESLGLFQRKKETLQKMLDIVGKDSKELGWRQKGGIEAYLSNVREVIPEVMKANTIDALWEQLGEGERAVYDFGLNKFAELRPEFLSNARLYNNVELDSNVDNYFPIDYQFYGFDANAQILDTSYDRSYSSSNMGGKSGSMSARDRVIKDGSMPKNGVIDFNFITNTFKNFGLQVADIETQGARMQIHHNVASRQLRESTDGFNFFGTIDDMMREEMLANYHGFYSSPRTLGLADKVKRMILTSTYGKALGGFGQAIKQFIPTISAALVRTGDAATLGWYFGNMSKVNDFIKNQNIARRGVYTSQMGGSVTNDLNLPEIPNKALRSINDALDWHEKIVSKGFLGPLRFGDMHGARAAWMMYYNQYAKREGIEVNLDEEPNQAAASYADTAVDLSTTPSVDADRPAFTRSMWVKMAFPFAGEAFTSFMNMSVNTSKLYNAIRTGDTANARQAMTAMLANTAAIASFQLTGWGVRYASYKGLEAVVNAAIDSIDLDDEDEELRVTEDLRTMLENYTDKRIDRNFENSSYYLTNDLLHRGLLSNGAAEPISEAVIKPLFEKVTGFKINSFRSTDANEAAFNELGIYGVAPAGIYSLWQKNKGAFDDAEAQLERSGYGAYFKADGEYGFKGVDGKQMPESLRALMKVTNLLSIPAAFGFQDQYVSSITRTMPSLYKQMENVVFKDVPKVKDVTNTKQFDEKFKTMNANGKSMRLDAKEEKEFRKAYDKAYKEHYKEYVKENEPLFGTGPKMEELASKYLYKIAKQEMLNDPQFKQTWDLKASKNK